MEKLPEGNEGIAGRYPGDAGIERDERVLFADGFEEAECPPGEKWTGQWFSGCRVAVTRGKGEAHSGRKALEMTAMRPSPEAVGCGVEKILWEGEDVLFWRYYMKFGKDSEFFHGGAHNGAGIDARRPGLGKATPGTRADGTNKYCVVLDTWRGDEGVASPGYLVVYVYHPEQRHNFGEQWFPSGRVLPTKGAQGQEMFGEEFVSREDFIPERDRWYCYELMVKANRAGGRDGRIAVWVDGELRADFPNLRLRDVDTLKMRRAWLDLYTHNERMQKPVSMWFDDVVMARSYIGPMAGKGAGRG